jgi:hypothetical protein
LRVTVRAVLDCLHAESAPVVLEAMYSLASLSAQQSQFGLDEGEISEIVRRIPELLHHKFAPVAYQTIDLLVWLKEYFPDFRDRMLRYLVSTDPGLRQRALFHYSSFCKPGEVKPLLAFEKDAYAADTGMGGSWVYELRDKALHHIERQLNRQFATQLRSEPYLGTRVEWRDWGPFLAWYTTGHG